MNIEMDRTRRLTTEQEDAVLALLTHGGNLLLLAPHLIFGVALKKFSCGARNFRFGAQENLC